MRPLLILAALIALPVAVIAHRQLFLSELQGPMLAQVMAALDDPKFAGVRREDVGLEYLDVTLRGWVPDPAARAEARRRVAAVRGVRFKEENNLLQVTPRLQARLEGEKLFLTGWLRDAANLRDAKLWLEESRPGLKVDTEDVHLSPFVGRVEPPPAVDARAVAPPFYAGAWNAIRANASLSIEKKGAAIRAAGMLPSAALREAVVAAVQGAKTGIKLDAAQLRGGAFVRPERFTDDTALPEFLRSFFDSPAPDFFTVSQGAIHLRAHATPELEQEWRSLIGPLEGDEPARLELRVLASVYHLPGYKPLSALAPDALNNLRAVLAESGLHFASGIHNVAPEDKPRLDAAAQAILAAGPAAHIVVGTHLDAEGVLKLNEESAQRRSDAVINELKSRGVPAAQLEPAIFQVAPAPDGGSQGRSVELLVK